MACTQFLRSLSCFSLKKCLGGLSAFHTTTIDKCINFIIRYGLVFRFSGLLFLQAFLSLSFFFLLTCDFSFKVVFDSNTIYFAYRYISGKVSRPIFPECSHWQAANGQIVVGLRTTPTSPSENRMMFVVVPVVTSFTQNSGGSKRIENNWLEICPLTNLTTWYT